MKHRRIKTQASGFIYVGKLPKEGNVTQELWFQPTESETPKELLDPQIALCEDQDRGSKKEREEESNPLVVLMSNNFDSSNCDPFLLFEDFRLATAR